jgi:hypothetical protein
MQAPSRRRPRDRDEVMAYLAERVRVGDIEWLSLLETRPDWTRVLEKWLKRPIA